MMLFHPKHDMQNTCMYNVIVCSSCQLSMLDSSARQPADKQVSHGLPNKRDGRAIHGVVGCAVLLDVHMAHTLARWNSMYTTYVLLLKAACSLTHGRVGLQVTELAHQAYSLC